MLILLVLRVLGLLLIPALIGQIKQIARNGMHTEVVRGLLGILVLHITETKLLVNHNLAVLMILQVVQASEMSLVVMDRLDVLGQAMIVLY